MVLLSRMLTVAHMEALGLEERLQQQRALHDEAAVDSALPGLLEDCSARRPTVEAVQPRSVFVLLSNLEVSSVGDLIARGRRLIVSSYIYIYISGGPRKVLAHLWPHLRDLAP